MRKSLVALLLLAASGLTQADVQLRDGHPQTYTVQPGDTLWDISARFLNQPWKWRELWQANPQVANPNLIYPGNVLHLMYVNGRPVLTVGRSLGGSNPNGNGTIKLSPQIRRTPIAEAIPTIPLDKINSFLLVNRVVDDASELERAPYILAGNAERVISGTGDRIYARGLPASNQKVYGLFRQGKTYTDPQTGEVLGINADDIGLAQIVATEGDVATLHLLKTTQEVRIGDRLLPTEERAVSSTFMPSEPAQRIDGQIIDVPRGVTQVGVLDVVTLNRGRRDGLEEGNVLAIYRLGETVRDRVSGQSVKVPDERAGILMVFRAYEKLSYGLVLNASRQLSVNDRITNP